MEYILTSNQHEIILLTKITAAQNDAALGYQRLRGLYFLGSCFCEKYRNNCLRYYFQI